MPADRQYKYKVNINQFNEKLAPKTPFIFTSNDKLRKLPLSVVNRNGFWMKLLLNGSGVPIARENSTLMPKIENG